MEGPVTCVLFLFTFTSLADNVQSLDGFYGSPLVLDAYCENREQYISAFTLPVNIVHVEGIPDDIHNKLMELNSTGRCLEIIFFVLYCLMNMTIYRSNVIRR